MFVKTDIRREVIGGRDSLLLQGDATMPQEALQSLAGQAQCVYIDPPFMTGEEFRRKRVYGESGWRTGKHAIQLDSYSDSFENREQYLKFLRGLIENSFLLLQETGIFCLHLDWRTHPYARMICDEIFGEKRFLNEIIWSYESGGRASLRYSRKHDTLLLYARSRKYHFDLTRVPLARENTRKNHLKRCVDEDGRTYRSIISAGKEYRYYDDEPTYPGDVWTDISHLQQRDPERTGFVTQKPLKLLDRVLKPAVRDGDLVVDLCCGSGTTMAAAQKLNCRFVGMDTQAEALHTTVQRLGEGFVLETDTSADEAVLDATFDPESGMLTLTGFDAPHPALPKQQDRLAFVEQWRAGRIVDGKLICDASFRRSRETPDLPVWCLLPDGEGEPAVSITDAAGRRWVFRWQADA